jgi:hypothetical protein
MSRVPSLLKGWNCSVQYWKPQKSASSSGGERWWWGWWEGGGEEGKVGLGHDYSWKRRMGSFGVPAGVQTTGSGGTALHALC